MRTPLQEAVGSDGDHGPRDRPGLHLEPSQLDGLWSGAGC